MSVEIQWKETRIDLGRVAQRVMFVGLIVQNNYLTTEGIRRPDGIS